MRKVLFSLLGGVSLLASSVGSSSAADVGVSDNPFNGFYMGVHGGYGWASSDVDYDFVVDFGILPDDDDDDDDDDFSGDYQIDSEGALLGLQAGANFVMGNGLLLGAEVSGTWAAISGDTSFSVLDDGQFGPPGITGVDVDVNNKLNGIGLAQVKLGWANDTFAVYGMGGFALGQFTRTVDVESRNFFAPFQIDGNSDYEDTLSGWTLGAGLDYMVTEGVSVGVSYNYVKFDGFEDTFDIDFSCFDCGPYSGSDFDIGDVESSGGLDVHIAKLNLNYHF